MSFFSGLNAEKYDRQYADSELLIRIWRYLRPFWKLLFIIVAMLGIMAGAGALQPIIVSYGLDQFQSENSAGLALGITAGILMVGGVRWLANWVFRRNLTRAIADVMLNLATDAFTASTQHDLSFYDAFSSGRIVSRITSDTRDFGQLVAISTELFAQVVQAVILGVVLARIEWNLFLYVMAVIPVVLILAISYRKLARRVTRQGMRAMAEVNATIKETISGISVAKNFRQEKFIYDDFTRANDLSYDVNVQRGLTLSIVFPTLNTLGGVATAVLVYVGGLSTIEGVVTAGSWFLFLMSLDRFLYPVVSLSSYLTQVQTGLAAAERVFALIDAEPVVRQIDHKPVSKLLGRVDFNHLDFYYKADEPVLQDFEIHIQPGENIALVGHTGAGKSTIAKLIARFYEFQGGEILIDGQDIRTFKLSDYRRKLGIVSQTPFLFSGSVLENIRYANSEAKTGDIEHLARQIGDGEWLDTLSDGLDTEVGERGSLLSMGQRQLVSLMRVLVLNPVIFILDEATASIDPFTEWQIQQALHLILERTTSILIAHRLSTVKSADRILVMRNGGIIEEGNHETLLRNSGHYSELYNTYFRHQSLAYIEHSRAIAQSRETPSK